MRESDSQGQKTEMIMTVVGIITLGIVLSQVVSCSKTVYEPQESTSLSSALGKCQETSSTTALNKAIEKDLSSCRERVFKLFEDRMNVPDIPNIPKDSVNETQPPAN